MNINKTNLMIKLVIIILAFVLHGCRVRYSCDSFPLRSRASASIRSSIFELDRTQSAISYADVLFFAHQRPEGRELFLPYNSCPFSRHGHTTSFWPHKILECIGSMSNLSLTLVFVCLSSLVRPMGHHSICAIPACSFLSKLNDCFHIVYFRFQAYGDLIIAQQTRLWHDDETI